MSALGSFRVAAEPSGDWKKTPLINTTFPVFIRVFNSSMLFWKAASGVHMFLETKRYVKRPPFEFGLEDTLGPLRD